MENKKISPKALQLILNSQKDEATDSIIYETLANKEKNPANKTILHKMSIEEKDHYNTWKSYTNKDISPNFYKILWYKLLSLIMGYTFVLKIIQKGENTATNKYDYITDEIPEAKKISEDEHRHEKELIAMLDEERLQYVGAIVLGLNDALVELTGTIAGLSFALKNTRLVALSGIITGISATLSMAASNYLAERTNDNPNALKSSFYTGIAYLITVALLVLPYLIFPNNMWHGALISMLCVVIIIILFFNYYISVAKDLPFIKRFLEMAGISLSVAGISFVIGILVKKFLNIDI
ncbi:VIT1/CCC1 transporter family protein [Fusobacterium sp. PH5-44]|uniref:VIT1/CCC1 transporter family protein n=1 Tax=unclassified Fusobacterium TaxID=2648384 RepID=UPI003D258B77